MKQMALGMACASALAWCGPARSDEPAQDPAKLFETLDANQDGKLAGDEVGEDRKRFFERLVRVGDKNDDKQLSRDEFVAAMTEQEKPVATPQPRFGGDRERPMASPGQMFDRLDRNRDGKFTKEEIPDQAPPEMRERMELIFTAALKSEVTREEFEKVMDKYGPPGGREGRRPAGARPPEGDRRTDGERRPEGDRPRPEGERGREVAREGDRPSRGPEGEREGMRGFSGFGGFRGMEGGRGGSPLVRVLDRNDDGKLSRKEVARIVDRFEELGRNGDGELEIFELVAVPFAGGPGGPFGRGFGGQPGFGMRRGEGDRGREMARESDRRPDGDRPRPEGPRDGDRPRPETGRDGDRPRPEGPRDGARPRPEMRDSDRPRPEGRPEGRPEAGPPRGDREPGAAAPRGRDGDRGVDFFGRLDRNSDGVISKDEAPERMKDRFKDLDGNDDGKITPEELRNAIARELGIPSERRERRPEQD